MLTPISQILGIVGALLTWRGGIVSQPWQVVVTVVLNLAIALLFLFKLPGLIPFTLSSPRVFYPEQGYALITGVAQGIGWSVIYPGLNLLARTAG